ncbi:LYR motif-containing protein 2 isoform X2 [Tyto alba]|uniref:LYR motif-containing protein 2 isoform X2 n=1 Tax=Tyto alba TaxID=56313 RepID=UPI001C668B57|nr:LYR motif-containing protein 2 isoform X2 [Tyto alba]
MAAGGRAAAGPRGAGLGSRRRAVMAARRLLPGALTLKQLYRKILRAIRDVPAEADRRNLKDWAREEFRRNKDATEEDAIRMMITQGNMQLQELQRTLKLAKS